MVRVFLLFVVAASSLMMGGCASDAPKTNELGARPSTIPWNRPERWEGQGAMGGMLNTR